MKNKPIKFKQSKTWWGEESLEWILQNALFAYNFEGHNGERPHIVTKIPMSSDITKLDCFELDSDRWGVCLKGQSQYSSRDRGFKITKSSTDVREFLKEYLSRGNCDPIYVNSNFFKTFAHRIKWSFIWKFRRLALIIEILCSRKSFRKK